MAGCTTGEDVPTTAGTGRSDGTETEASNATDTATEPVCREAVLTITRPSDTDGGAVFSDATVEASVVEESGERHFIVRGIDRTEIRERLDRAGATVLFVGTIDWCSQPVCDARTFLLLQSDSEAGQMRSDFPDSVAVLRGASTGGGIRIVYSTSSSDETLFDRARRAGYETATAISGSLATCETS